MKDAQKKFLFILIAMLPLLLACLTSLPQGWRRPTDKELCESWRQESGSKYAGVREDFNGDGIVDEAKLLTREDGKGFGLFAFVSQKDGSCKTYQLDEVRDSELLQVMGIQSVASGVYKTACGKGYFDCQKDELPEVVINTASIDYFKVEGANSFFYWNENTRSFKRVWISD